MMTRMLLGMLSEEAAGDLVEESAARGRWWLWQQAVRSAWWSVREDIAPALVAALGAVLLPLLMLDRFWAYVYSLIPLRDGLGREPWMLAFNTVVTGLLCVAARRRGTAVSMPLAAAAGWWLGIADAGVWYGLQLVGVCWIAGGRRRSCD